jgi:glycosyltransferase involved in cell wall biosynthesis
MEAVTRQPLEPGDWMERLAATVGLVGPAHSTSIGCPFWELIVTPKGFHLYNSHQLSANGSVIFPHSEKEVGIRRLWGWRRRGFVTVWFLEDSGWKQCNLASLVESRFLNRLGRFLPSLMANLLGLNRPTFIRQAALLSHRLRRRPGFPEVLYPFHIHEKPIRLWEKPLHKTEPLQAAGDLLGKPLRITHYIGALFPGGAERQLANLAGAQPGQGHTVNVLTTEKPKGEGAHYLPLFKAAGIPLRQATTTALTNAMVDNLNWHMLRGVPREIRPHVSALAVELAANRPHVLHCWLDQPNVIGAFAGLIADVPLIVLSTRNANPTNFPRINFPYLQHCYQVIAQSASPRVRFIANSHSGAASYAHWIGIPRERFHVVFNGVQFDHFPKATSASRWQARQSFQLKPTDRVLVGAFRLAEEKQPELFLEVVRAVKNRVSDLQVLLAGEGDLKDRVHSIVRAHGMEHYVRLLGRRTDVATVFLAADASLLTSHFEGCPNAALESQYLGVPIVATAAGGTVDAVLHGETGLLAPVGDVAGLTDSVVAILTDEHLRSSLAGACSEFVCRRFSLDAMTTATADVYQSAFKECGRSLLQPAA